MTHLPKGVPTFLPPTGAGRLLSRTIGLYLALSAVPAFTPFAAAAERCELPETYGFAEPRPRGFMVSGVLRKSSAGVEIKLVHMWEQAKSGDEALGSFTRKALTEYPGYTIATTLVSEAPAAATRCDRRPSEQGGKPGIHGTEI